MNHRVCGMYIYSCLRRNKCNLEITRFLYKNKSIIVFKTLTDKKNLKRERRNEAEKLYK